MKIRSFQPARPHKWMAIGRSPFNIPAASANSISLSSRVETNLTGTQQGELYKAELEGSIHATQIELRSVMPVSGNAIPWTFKGEVQGNKMAGHRPSR